MKGWVYEHCWLVIYRDDLPVRRPFNLPADSTRLGMIILIVVPTSHVLCFQIPIKFAVIYYRCCVCIAMAGSIENDQKTNTWLVHYSIHNLPNGAVLIFSAVYRHLVAIVGETHSAGAVCSSWLSYLNITKRNMPAHCAAYGCVNRSGSSVKVLLSEILTFY